MTATGQSLRDPSGLMRRVVARHNNRVISQQIAHVDTDFSKSNPINYSKHSIYFGTWNVLSLVSSSSQLYQLSQNIDQYSLDILGVTETHMPGSGSTLLDNAMVVYLFILVGEMVLKGKGLAWPMSFQKGQELPDLLCTYIRAGLNS